jgi:hypothetical protein
VPLFCLYEEAFMPLGLFTDETQTAVYMTDPDGNKTGQALASFDDESDAKGFLSDLTTAISEYGDSLDDFTSNVRRAFDRQFASPTGDMDTWPVDVFPDHVIVRSGDHYYRVPFTQGDNNTFTFSPQAEWTQVMLDYVPVFESLAADSVPLRVVFVSEFQSSPPDIPLAPGVDRELLERTPNGERDPNPMYLTLEVARVGAVSGNKFKHTPELVDSVVEQINTDRPGGIMGHIKPQDRGVSFPIADIHWIGATRVGESAWAKGYIPSGRQDVREYYRAEKAKGGKAATSLYGGGRKQTYNNGEWSVQKFKLESLDLAPWTRAAWPGTGQFTLTAEIQANDSPQTEKIPVEEQMDINWDEITYEDLPASVVEMVMARNPVPDPEPAPPVEPDQTLVTELTQVRETNDALTTRVQELENELADNRAKAFDLMVDQIVAEFTDWDVQGNEKAASAVTDLRSNFRTVLVAEFAATRAQDEAPELQAVAETVWNATFTNMAAAIRDLVSGGPARIARSHSFRDVELPSADAVKRARAKMGI